MNYSIRQNVFETNSSSSHSLCFNKDEKELKYDQIDFVEISESNNDFYGEVNTVKEKIVYVCCFIAMVETDDINEFLENEKFKWLKEMLFEYNATIVTLNTNDMPYGVPTVSYDYGKSIREIYSEDEKEFKENMKHFIFNPNSYVLVNHS